MTIHAVYENGVFRPTEKVDLPDRCEVEVEIRRVEETLKAPDLTPPRDEWERRLRSAATDCGISLSNDAISSEGLYD